MTRARVERELATTKVEAKSTTDYVTLAETCALPSGDGSLPDWLARAKATFDQLIDGEDRR
jgi:hypothetical protein